ncbi:MAG: TonB-dependent receptor [Pseudomonadota bacterium]|jgi:outer membrane receptor protein involved in Fe transport|uniref:TonB-dependent receptor n=1 Tax=hydrothermal vent metagenome TaxID=652676 RepID=A0A160TRQ2_9ZZZZ
MRHYLCGTAWTALALATIGSAIPLSSASAQTQAQPSAEEPASDDIVVTARKRNERLQDAPLSVSAFSATDLRQGNARDFKDVLRKVPGVSFSGAELGQSRYSIRGVSTTSPSPTVGIYLDDISLLGATNAFSGAADPVFFDFSRVEILKGPQGTLYGGSAMGGAIKYVSHAPELGKTTLDTAAGVSTTAHGGISYQAEAVLNLPLSDKLALRTGVLYRNNAGYIDNVANGLAVDARTSTTAPPAALTPLARPSLSTLADRNQNSDHVLAVKAALLWQPDPSLDITPSLFRQAYRQKNTGTFWTNLPDLQSSFRLVQPTDDDLGVYSLNMVKHLGGVDITSLTGYVDRSVKFDRDYSFYIATLVPALYGVNSPNASNSSTRTFSQEVRAASSNPAARLRWTVGLYYAHQRDELDQTVKSIGVGGLLGTGTDTVYHGNTLSKLTQYAAFADLTFEILPGLDATAALRYFNLKQTIDTRGDGVLNGGDTHGTASTRQSGVNPKFELAYRASRDALIYASAAKGFRPGGGNPFAVAPSQCQADLVKLGLSSVPVSYRSDSLWTYEVGSKNQFLDRRLTLNGAAFYTDWKNIQQNVFLPGCGFSFSGNVGGAEIKGAELSSQFTVDGLTLGAAASYTDAKISKSATGVSARVGQPVLDTPKWIASANIAYHFPIGGGTTATARADYQYRSSSLRMFENSFIVTTPTGPVSANNVTQRQKAYDVVNLGLLIDTGSWQVDLFVNNLLDKAPLLDHNVVSGIEAAITLRPRTMGVGVRRQF